MKHTTKLSVLFGSTALLGTMAQASTDYGPAIWRSAYSGHWYTSGYGHKFHVIHDMEGYYASTISYFQKSTTSASVHYCVNGIKDTSTDYNAGEVTQMVRDAYYAWHVCCWNRYCTGTEHEGFASNPAWYTEALYQASAGVTTHECDRNGFAKDRNHVVGHNEWQNTAWKNWAAPNFGINVNCNTHHDPGPYWDWSHYMNLVTGSAVNNASVVSASVPSSVGLGKTFTASVTMNNNGTKTWNSDGTPHNLGSQSPQDNTTWGFNRVGLAGATVSPGQNHTFSATFTAPSTAGSYPFAWRMVEDGVEWFGATYSTTINVVTINDASFVSVSAPSTVAPGQVFSATITMNNNGSKTWTAASSYNLGSQDPQDNGTWGTGRIPVPGTISPGQNCAFTYNFTAPTTPGTYSFNWKMVQDGVEWFGAKATANISVVVTPPSITANPVTHTNNVGDTTSFTVSASGTAPFTYQWKKNGADITGATSSALTLSNVQLSDGAFYRAVVSNSGGSATSADAQLVIAQTPSPVGGGTGLVGNYYDNMDFTTLKITRTDATVNFNWGSGSPDPSIGVDTFSVRWVGKVQPRYSQTYTFYTATDDGVRLWVNGVLLIDKWVDQGGTEWSGTISLTAGQNYDIQMDYYENGGGASATLSWSSASNVKEIIPQTQLIVPIPNAPSGLSATPVSTTAINLAWTDNSSDETAFKVERATSSGGPWTQITTTAANVASYSDSGLSGNTTYYYRVRSSNNAGDSAYTSVASALTQPNAPSALAATAVAYNQINVSWTDNSAGQNGTKLERAPASGGPWTSIATNAAGVTTYSDAGLSAKTTYYYQVKAYNASGDSAYSATASALTPPRPPALSGIGNKTVAANTLLTFGCSATDFNQVVTTTAWQDFESFTNNTPNEQVMFRKPLNSSTTSAFVDTTVTNFTRVTTSFPSGHASAKVMMASWSFKSGTSNPWIRLNTFNPTFVPNPTIDLDQVVQFDIYSDKSVNLALGLRETGTTAAIGANGGTTGSIEFDAASGVSGTAPIPTKTIPANTWTTVSYNVPFESQYAFTGDGMVVSGQKGVMEHLAVIPNGGSGVYNLYVDNFNVVTTNSLTWSLDPGYPAGATIHPKTGVFKWTPTTGQAGQNYFVTIRVTDSGSPAASSYETIKITVLQAANSPPVLGAIGNKTVSEGSALTFTATATDPDAGQTLTYSLDAGAPSGATINASTGAFSWTPTEAQGPGSYNITVRVTDNGTPATNDYETITVTVNEVNTAPALSVIANQTVNEGSTLSLTASATDADVPANSITYTLDAGAPSGATIDAATGAFTWTPTEAQGPGTYPITVRATDNGTPALADTKTFNVTVNEVNSAPSLAAISDANIAEGSTLTINATATDADLPANTLTFSLDPGAPSGASITAGGVFTWTPSESQGPGTYAITVRATDNGSPVLSDAKTFNVTVDEVNVAPVLAAIADQTVNELATLSVTASATDADLPANTITYSLDAGAPSGMSINSSSGAISWTPTETQGPGTYPVTVRATDNGSPALSDAKTFNVTVNEVNTAPSLTVVNTVTTIESVSDFEAFGDGTYNGTVMFRQPSFSSTTSAFIDTTAANSTSVKASFPAGNLSSKVMQASFSIKTGQTNPWLRLSTFNAASLPNPTIRFDQHVKFDIYTDKNIAVGLGVRETSTGSAVGDNGGTTGALEFVGVSSLTGTMPNPTRTVTAGAWTTLDFNMPAEPVTAFPSSGNGVLNSTTGKGVLEHLALVPVGGTGAYNVYIDNIQVVTVLSNLTVNTGETLTFTNTATDADFPAQALTFSLDAGAPTGAAIDPTTGIFSWTPTGTQGPSTNVITIRVTDDGPGTLSDAKNVTVVVNHVNGRPTITGVPNQAVEIQGGSAINLTITATDPDNDPITFSLQGTPPTGASIDANTGVFTWTPPNTLSTNVITVRASDNGNPPLYDEKDMTIIVTPTNAAPALTLPNARIVEKMVNFESISDFGNDHVMFRKPSNSSSTSAFIDTTVTNYAQVTTSFPTGNTNAGSKVLKVGWTFKTGTGQWVRLTTAGAPLIPNPTMELSGGRIKFDVYSDKSIKVAIGVRETGTAAAIGANGGTTGGIEWLGATKSGSTPVPSRTVNANTWTTLEFTNASEFCTNFSGGNSVLASGRGVLEHLVIVPNAGAGAYTMHLDNFEVVTTPALSGTITMNSGSAMTFTASATDPDPGSGLNFGLNADAPAGATIDMNTGAFSWTPATGGTTNALTVFVNDNPTNGAIAKTSSSSFTVVVNTDPLGVQSGGGVASTAAGETVTLTWPAVPGTSYQVQAKSGDEEWTNVGAPIVADSAEGSAQVSNSGSETYYRILTLDSGSGSDQ